MSDAGLVVPSPMDAGGFFGGNNSNTYSWGPTMQSVYYIDDVIIDEERIGPRYFEIIR